MASITLTPDGGDTVSVQGGRGWFDARAAATNRGTNHRQVLYVPAVSPSVDQQSCATWASQGSVHAQQGLALRIRREADGRVRALTVTKNVLWGAQWNFNVTTWDSARSDFPARQVGSVSLADVFFVSDPPRVLPLPWRVCARADGSAVTVKAWPAERAEPSWADGRYVGSVALPPGWTFAGKPGWYIGHLPPGAAARFEHLQSADLFWATDTP